MQDLKLRWGNFKLWYFNSKNLNSSSTTATNVQYVFKTSLAWAVIILSFSSKTRPCPEKPRPGLLRLKLGQCGCQIVGLLHRRISKQFRECHVVSLMGNLQHGRADPVDRQEQNTKCSKMLLDSQHLSVSACEIQKANSGKTIMI